MNRDGYFRDDKGNRSMIRLLAFMCFFLGGIVAVGGLACSMAQAVISGTALAAVGIGMKGIQKRFENGGG